MLLYPWKGIVFIIKNLAFGLCLLRTIELCIHFQVIDEILHVLSTISHVKVKSSSSIFILSERPLRTHEVLKELRDISSMAIDHFEDKIAPSLKKAYCELPTRSLLTCTQYQCMLFHFSTIIRYYLNGICFYIFVIIITDSPDVSINSTCLSIPSLYSQMQYCSSSSLPPKQTIARPLDAYQTNFIWMERKLKTAMRKVI